MNETTHDDIRAHLAAYALDILTEFEKDRVDRHLATCAACRADLAAYRRVADDLAYAAPEETPDPLLKQRLMARIQTEGTTVVSQPPTSRWEAIVGFMQSWQPVAVALALILVVLVALLWQQGRRPEVLPGRQIALTATDVAPEARGIIHISENGSWGTLIVEDLPALDPDRQYQLWLIRDGERVSGGVFSVPEQGYASINITAPEPLDGYAAFGITIEPFGGSPGPTGDRVLGYNL